jgi:hypothetical protein
MHGFCEKIWNQGYEARRKLDHMVAEKRGTKTASDWYAETQQNRRK